jgi:hypothetical protein
VTTEEARWQLWLISSAGIGVLKFEESCGFLGQRCTTQVNQKQKAPVYLGTCTGNSAYKNDGKAMASMAAMVSGRFSLQPIQ